ncbi:MAG: adenylyltransferase/cytidyltransferase family protein, partial [Candidatus Aenigmatarchaeota archaeon]
MKKVLVGGCFNKIHKGHIFFLKEAKKLGDSLVVVLTHDKNNKKPYRVSAKERKRNLEKLRIADKVIIGAPKNFSKVVLKEKPSIIALGYDQKLPHGVENIVKKMNIRVVRIKKFGNYATRKIVNKNFKKKLIMMFIYIFPLPIPELFLFLQLSFLSRST